MDVFNNANTIIGIIVGLLSIGGSIFSVIKYLQRKATSVQQKQTAHLSPSSNPSASPSGPKLLSIWDWGEIFWLGLEDNAKAREGAGCGVPITILLCGLIVFGAATSNAHNDVAPILWMIVFIVLWIFVVLLFYTYFVGRRVEQKIEEKTEKIARKAIQITKKVP